MWKKNIIFFFERGGGRDEREKKNYVFIFSSCDFIMIFAVSTE